VLQLISSVSLCFLPLFSAIKAANLRCVYASIRSSFLSSLLSIGPFGSRISPLQTRSVSFTLVCTCRLGYFSVSDRKRFYTYTATSSTVSYWITDRCVFALDVWGGGYCHALFLFDFFCRIAAIQSNKTNRSIERKGRKSKSKVLTNFLILKFLSCFLISPLTENAKGRDSSFLFHTSTFSHSIDLLGCRMRRARQPVRGFRYCGGNNPSSHPMSSPYISHGDWIVQTVQSC